MTIPEGVKEIGDIGVIYDLQALVVPESVTSIDEESFSSLLLKTFTMFVQPGSYAEEFAKNHKLNYDYGLPLIKDGWLLAKDGTTLLGFLDEDDKIDSDAFSFFVVCQKNHAVIPPFIKQIALGAFSWHYQLDHLVIPETVEKIEDILGVLWPTVIFVKHGSVAEDFALHHCSKHTHVEYGGTSNIQGDYLLSNDGTKLLLCLSFEPSSEIPESVTTIASRAFNFTRGTTINLPKNLKRIEEWAFYYTNWQYLKMPESIEFIDDESFYCCEYLIMNAKPDSAAHELAKKSPYKPLNQHEYLKKYSSLDMGIRIELCDNPRYENGYHVSQDGKTLYSLEDMNIEIAVIPEGIERIDSYAFRGSKNLKEVRFSHTVREIGIYAFDNCHALTAVEIPPTIEVVGENAFSFSGLERIKNDRTKTKVLYDAFLDTRLTRGKKKIKYDESFTTKGGCK